MNRSKYKEYLCKIIHFIGGFFIFLGLVVIHENWCFPLNVLRLGLLGSWRSKGHAGRPLCHLVLCAKWSCYCWLQFTIMTPCIFILILKRRGMIFFFFGKCFSYKLQIRSELLKCMQTDFFNFRREEKRELSARQLFLQLYFMEKNPCYHPSQSAQYLFRWACTKLFFLHILVQTQWLEKNGSCPLKIVTASEE